MSSECRRLSSAAIVSAHDWASSSSSRDRRKGASVSSARNSLRRSRKSVAGSDGDTAGAGPVGATVVVGSGPVGATVVVGAIGARGDEGTEVEGAGAGAGADWTMSRTTAGGGFGAVSADGAGPPTQLPMLSASTSPPVLMIP